MSGHLSCYLWLGKSSAFCSSASDWKSIFENPYAALRKKKQEAYDVVSLWLKYSLGTKTMSDWNRVSRFPSATEITEA